jgi:hypothetical protein
MQNLPLFVAIIATFCTQHRTEGLEEVVMAYNEVIQVFRASTVGLFFHTVRMFSG